MNEVLDYYKNSIKIMVLFRHLVLEIKLQINCFIVAQKVDMSYIILV